MSIIYGSPEDFGKEVCVEATITIRYLDSCEANQEQRRAPLPVSGITRRRRNVSGRIGAGGHAKRDRAAPLRCQKTQAIRPRHPAPLPAPAAHQPPEGTNNAARPQRSRGIRLRFPGQQRAPNLGWRPSPPTENAEPCQGDTLPSRLEAAYPPMQTFAAEYAR